MNEYIPIGYVPTWPAPDDRLPRPTKPIDGD